MDFRKECPSLLVKYFATWESPTKMEDGLLTYTSNSYVICKVSVETIQAFVPNET
jgi:hypothetical protein